MGWRVGEGARVGEEEGAKKHTLTALQCHFDSTTVASSSVSVSRSLLLLNQVFLTMGLFFYF